MKYKIISAIVCISIILFQPANQFVEAFVHFGYAKAGFIEISMPVDHETEQPQETNEPKVVETVAQPAGFDLTDPYIGQTIAGYRVTSLQGPRRSPCAGCSSHHNGLDLGTPIGTPLFAPGKIEVTCHVDSGGGGHFAQFHYADMLWQSLHLKAGSCKPGGYNLGEQFAQTGNTGRGTGAHLHLQLRMQDRSFIKVKTGHAQVLLTQQGGK